MGKWISDPYSTPKPPKAGKRHPLLLYHRFSDQVFWSAILIFAICAALIVWNPAPFQPYRLHLGIILVGVGLILVLTLVFRLTSYVQCRLDGLRIQTPFQRIRIPYASIRLTRPTQLYQYSRQMLSAGRSAASWSPCGARRSLSSSWTSCPTMPAGCGCGWASI